METINKQLKSIESKVWAQNTLTMWRFITRANAFEIEIEIDWIKLFWFRIEKASDHHFRHSKIYYLWKGSPISGRVNRTRLIQLIK